MGRSRQGDTTNAESDKNDECCVRIRTGGMRLHGKEGCEDGCWDVSRQQKQMIDE